MFGWLKENKDAITSLKDVVTMVVSVIGLVMIAVAVCNWKWAINNDRSKTLFQISSEFREVTKLVNSKDYKPEQRAFFVVEYIYTIWTLHRFGTIDDLYWRAFSHDMCIAAKESSNDSVPKGSEPIKWDSPLQHYPTDFVEEVREIQKAC
jgi:hypothetical protein